LNVRSGSYCGRSATKGGCRLHSRRPTPVLQRSSTTHSRRTPPKIQRREADVADCSISCVSRTCKRTAPQSRAGATRQTPFEIAVRANDGLRLTISSQRRIVHAIRIRLENLQYLPELVVGQRYGILAVLFSQGINDVLEYGWFGSEIGWNGEVRTRVAGGLEFIDEREVVLPCALDLPWFDPMKFRPAPTKCLSNYEMDIQRKPKRFGPQI
jgi:hypothetical protein